MNSDDISARIQYGLRVDAITREIILKLTSRVSDLEAALEVHRGLLKEIMQTQALAAGTTFIPAAFDLRTAEAVVLQREKMAMGITQPEPAVGAPVYLEVPGET